MNQSQCRNKRGGGAPSCPPSPAPRPPPALCVSPQICTPCGQSGAGGDLPRSSLAECPGTENLVRAPGLLAHRLPFAPPALSRVCDLGVASAKAGLRIPCARSAQVRLGFWKSRVLRATPLPTRSVCACVWPLGPVEGAPEDKLLQSFHGFLSCPNLGTGIITLEETGIRYSAFVSFVLTVSLHFQSSTHTEYLTDTSITKSQVKEEMDRRRGLRFLLRCLRNIQLHAGHTPVGQGPVPLTKGQQGIGGNWVLLPYLVHRAGSWGVACPGRPPPGEFSRQLLN